MRSWFSRRRSASRNRCESASSGTQRLQQRRCAAQVCRREAFGESIVDRLERGLRPRSRARASSTAQQGSSPRAAPMRMRLADARSRALAEKRLSAAAAAPCEAGLQEHLAPGTQNLRAAPAGTAVGGARRSIAGDERRVRADQMIDLQRVGRLVRHDLGMSTGLKRPRLRLQHQAPRQACRDR